MPSFTLLTVNIHKGFTFFNRSFILHELREAVRSVSADVLFLQEVLGAHQAHSRRHPGWPQAPHYEFLADTLWPQFAYGRNAVYPDGHHGNALLSKFPIVRHENRDVSVGGHEERGLLWCVLSLPGHEAEIHAVCVHLGLLEAHRCRQIDVLCRLVDEEIPPAAPLLVAGDFNDWRLRAHTVLRRCAGLREVFVEARGRVARTYPARWPLLALDRIYVRNVVVRQTRVWSAHPWSHLSDHVPLAAELEL